MSEDDTDDDWFESALREDDAESSDAVEDATAEEDTREASTDDHQSVDGTDETGFGGSDSEFGGRSDGESDASSDDGFSGGESPFGEMGAGGPFGDVGGDSAFEEGTGDGAPGGTDAFGGDPGGDLFEDDFADAMGSMGGDADFDDEDLDSEIPRIDLGVEGLDNMIQGGIPKRHLMVAIGGAGTGKTTLGMQFIHHGLQKEDTDRGVFITLEQTHDDIVATADEHGWEFERHEREDDLVIIDLDPIEMANSLDNIQSELPALIEDFDADRFVLDSVSLLEMMYDDVATRRTQIFDFTQSLKSAGVTTVLTSEANEDNPYASRHGIIEYLTDAVFLLRYVRSETQETRLAVEIQKIRNANHSRETKPYDLTVGGISVYEQANIF